MGLQKRGDWKKALKLLNEAPERIYPATIKAMGQEAHKLRALIVAKFRNLQPPQSWMTMATGGKGKPLVRTGALRKSVSVVDADDGFFIGIHRTEGTYQLALIHESGATIVMDMSEKQRKYLHAVLGQLAGKVGGGGGGTGVLAINIPARPFVGPVWQEQEGKVPKRVLQRIAKLLNNEYGWPG